MNSIKSKLSVLAISFIFTVLFMPFLATAAGSCDISPGGTYIEAENFTRLLPPGSGSYGKFVVENRESNRYTPGYHGSGYLLSSGGKSNGTTCYTKSDGGKGYNVNFTQAGTYTVWIRGYAQGPSSDSVFIGLDGTCLGSLNENGVYNRWVWTNNIQNGTNTINITSPGEHIFNIWIRDNEHLTDTIYITRGTETPDSEPQCHGCPSCSLNTGATTKIMPLGDSITHGIGSSGPCDNGYRKPLYEKLQNAGYYVSFIGSRVHGDTCDFDRLHEGHPGKTADFIRDNIVDYLAINPADIVLLHIGTNDINKKNEDVADIVTEVGQILDNIYQVSQDITVVLALIINQVEKINGGSNPNYARTTDFNNQLDEMARARMNAGYNIIIVDMESEAGIVYRMTNDCGLSEECDMADKLHPNDNGYEKMADLWFNALGEFFNQQIDTVAPAPPTGLHIIMQ